MMECPWAAYYGKSRAIPIATSLYTILMNHLAARIRDLDTRSVMGVPGDMNLDLLDYIKDVDGLNWSENLVRLTEAHTDIGFLVGTANELGAAYAADAYSRINDSPGVGKD